MLTLLAIISPSRPFIAENVVEDMAAYPLPPCAKTGVDPFRES
jgi:hypothetical protein